MLKKVYSLLGILFLAIVLSVGGFLAYHYHGDLPVETLKAKYADQHSQFIEIDGMPVHYQRKGQGPPLVLVHGFSGHVWNWRAWMQALPNNYELIAMDLPGFGLTGPRPDKDYSTQANIAFLDKFLSQIGIDTFYLAGNSMGGGIAWHYSLAYPDKVKKLILIDAAGYPKKNKQTIAGFKLLEYPIFHGLITKITPRFIIKKSLAGTYVNQSFAAEKEVDLYMDMLRRTGNRQVLIDRMKVRKEKKFDFRIKDIPQPTLIMWGDKDIIIPVENAHLFHQDIKNSKLIIYENVGHLPMDEVGLKSAKDVKAFLEK